MRNFKINWIRANEFVSNFVETWVEIQIHMIKNNDKKQEKIIGTGVGVSHASRRDLIKGDQFRLSYLTSLYGHIGNADIRSYNQFHWYRPPRLSIPIIQLINRHNSA